MRPYYIVSGGHLVKKDNSLAFIKENAEEEIPVESVDSVIIYGNTTISTPVIELLSQKGIPVFLHSYYGRYFSSILPENYLQGGQVTVLQAKTYLDPQRRMELARSFVKGAGNNFNKILTKYRAGKIIIPTESIENSGSVTELMGIEGNIAQSYFEAIDTILPEKFRIVRRVRRPPNNFGNALISFLNSLVYSITASEIFSTHLNPEISFLHEPGVRRTSLSLDVSEIFKPLLSHSVAISLIKTRQITQDSFKTEHGILLTEIAKKKVLEAFDRKLMDTYYVSSLKRNVSNKHLIRLELYKLEKAILGEIEYKPFKPRRW